MKSNTSSEVLHSETREEGGGGAYYLKTIVATPPPHERSVPLRSITTKLGQGTLLPYSGHSMLPDPALNLTGRTPASVLSSVPFSQTPAFPQEHPALFSPRDDGKHERWGCRDEPPPRLTQEARKSSQMAQGSQSQPTLR